MKPYLRFVSLSLMVVLLLAGCEIPRPGGDTGDAPGLTTPVAAVSPSVVAGTPGPEIPPPGATVPPAGQELPEEGPPAAVAPDAAAVEPGTVLVKLDDQAAIQARNAEIGGDNIVTAGLPSLDQRLREIGATSMEPVVEDVADAIPDESLESLSAQATEVSQLYTVAFPADQSPQEVAAILAQDPTVEYAEPNFLAGITAEPQVSDAPRFQLPGENRGSFLTPNDPLFSYQWHLQSIQMPAAWDSATGQQITVAIIDTGVAFTAPDLSNTNRLPGYDFANNDADPTDDQGHGTHVAGTIAQSTNNGVGVAGVAFSARLLPVKTLGSNGQGSYDNIIKGIVYAVDQGARVINMSLAGRTGSQALREAVQYAYDRGVVVVAAAGNSGGRVEFPAAYDEFVIGVGATRFDNTRASYSNFGPEVDLMAPGGDLDVDQNNDGYADGVLQQSFRTPGRFTYLFFEGTSMASPHVAGMAALLLSRDASLSPTQVENIMAQTAQNLGANDQNGAGLIQAAAALGTISVPPVSTGTVTGTPIAIVTTPAPTPTFTLTPTPTSTFTPIAPTDTPTPTTEPISEHNGDLTPAPVCTPPACQPGEVFYCPGDCPGGCGTQCATPTPLPVTPVVTPTLTPIVSPTVTPGPPPAGELLVNGGFESDEAWIFGDTPIRGGYDTTIKLSGNRSARLGTTSGPDIFSFSSVWQRLTIPAEANQASLRVNLYPVSQDAPGSGDVQNIMILNSNFKVMRTLSKELSNSQTWESRSFDLSDLKGQTIYVYFSVVNLGGTGRPTALYVDDVSLIWN
jgi:serine protease